LLNVLSFVVDRNKEQKQGKILSDKMKNSLYCLTILLENRLKTITFLFAIIYHLPLLSILALVNEKAAREETCIF